MSLVAEKPNLCPRCGATEFEERDCGPDSYDDDIAYTSYVCKGCALWFSGWTQKWLVDVTTWQEEDDALEFVPIGAA
jgi:hypothetical protein